MKRPANDEFLGTSERVVASLDSSALRKNYLAIQAQVPTQAVLPMVKADGYGHGAEWVSRNLLDLPNLYGLGVATFKEGSELRRGLGARARRTRIIVFCDASLWTDEKGQYCERFGLTPLIATDKDWESFTRGGWDERIPFELQFNTGMNRLGISMNLVPKIAKYYRGADSVKHPQGVSSHFAIGEDPEAKLSRQQVERFAWLRGQLEEAVPATQFHLGNSAGIWNHKYYKLEGLTDAVRPGIGLYGVTPWAGAPERGIQPVMTLRASIVGTHCLQPGDSIGYCATFTVKGTKPVHAAIIGAGYADGISRALSNGGHVWLNGAASKFLGVISMDLAAVQCTEKSKVGDWVEILGPHVDPWAQAKAAGTIPYELLTSVSSRVQRIYD